MQLPGCVLFGQTDERGVERNEGSTGRTDRQMEQCMALVRGFLCKCAGVWPWEATGAVVDSTLRVFYLA